MIRRKVTIQINAHENFYNKMEQYRKMMSEKGINLSHPEITNLMSRQIRLPKIDLIGGGYGKRKKR